MNDQANRAIDLPSFDPDDADQFHTFKLDAAGIVRDILAAHLKVSSTAIDYETLKQWPGIADPPWSISWYLDHAAISLEQFNAKYGHPFGSNPNDENDSDLAITQVESILDLMSQFTGVDVLKSAAQLARERKEHRIDWKKTYRQEFLREIRIATYGSPAKKRRQKKAVGNSDQLLTDGYGVIRYRDTAPIMGVRKGIWLFLDCLIKNGNFATLKVLDQILWTGKEGASTSRLAYRIRDTRKFFSSNNLPFTVGRSHDRDGCPGALLEYKSETPVRQRKSNAGKKNDSPKSRARTR